MDNASSGWLGDSIAFDMTGEGALGGESASSGCSIMHRTGLQLGGTHTLSTHSVLSGIAQARNNVGNFSDLAAWHGALFDISSREADLASSEAPQPFPQEEAHGAFASLASAMRSRGQVNEHIALDSAAPASQFAATTGQHSADIGTQYQPKLFTVACRNSSIVMMAETRCIDCLPIYPILPANSAEVPNPESRGSGFQCNAEPAMLVSHPTGGF